MTLKKYKLFSLNTIVVFLLCVHTFNAGAQECDNSRATMIDSSRFDINGDGTVTDIESGLTWQRCVMGQMWNGLTCDGEPKLVAWNAAMEISKSVKQTPDANFDNDTSWRIPKLNELAGIVDIRCKSPRIDLSLFPKTSAKPFWTTNNAPGTQKRAYTLSFGAEGVSPTSKF